MYEQTRGMHLTEVISASDSPFMEHGRQHFDEKRHPDFRGLPFQPLIGDLIPFNGPEMSTFSNDTMRDTLKPSQHSLPFIPIALYV
jgi:hypothetical protein